MDLAPFLTSPNAPTLILQNGQYLTKKQMEAVANSPPTQPKWMPNHPDPLWHSGWGQEVRIVGIVETGGALMYQVSIVNSADTSVKMVVEAALSTLDEAQRSPDLINDKLPINRAPWGTIKEAMLKFLISYPLDSEKRKQIEYATKRKGGYAQQIIDERLLETGLFLSEEDFTTRMSRRAPDFPWSRLAEGLDFGLTHQ